MKHLKKAAAAALCAALLVTLAACGSPKLVEKQIFSMDTVMTLKAYGSKAEEGLSSAIGMINSMNAMLDPENEDSAVYELNHARGQSVVVRGQIVEMLQTADTVYQRTGGAFDLTVYPLVKAWGFINGNYRVPTDEDIAALLERVDFSALELTGFADGSDYMLTMPDGMQLSFGAIAKGCAAQYAISALRSAGVESAIISLGGNVQTLGVKPDGTNWNVAIQDPNDTGSTVGYVSVGETAVVTSGGYQRYFEDEDGVRYHHILDPATGAPANSGLLSVTIICPNGTMADALSTAMFILGEDDALEYWRTYGGFEMILITEDARVVATSGLYDTFQRSSENYTYGFES